MELSSRVVSDQLPNRLESEAVTPAEELFRQAATVESPHWFSTSRSGKAVPYVDPTHIGRICADAMRIMGFGQDDLLLNLCAPPPHLSGFAATQATERLGATVCNEHFEDYDRVFQSGTAADVTAIVSIPSKAIDLARDIEDRYGPPRELLPSLSLGMFGGEPLRPAQRAELKDRWGLEETREFYGSSETTLVAVGVDETRRLVPLLNHFIVEIDVGDRILDVRECEGMTTGSILITDPHRKSVDLIRYRQGDRIRVHPDGDLPRIEPLGRSDDAIGLDGAIVHPTDLRAVTRAVFGVGVECVLYVRDVRAPTELDVVVGASDDRSVAFYEELLARIPALEHALGSAVADRIRLVTAESRDQIPDDLRKSGVDGVLFESGR